MGARTEQDKSFARLIQIGIALSAERNHDRLMERILIEAKDMCNADGGTLYLRSDDDQLKGTSKNAQMSPNRGSGRHPASGFWRSVAPERLI